MDFTDFYLNLFMKHDKEGEGFSFGSNFSDVIYECPLKAIIEIIYFCLQYK